MNIIKYTQARNNLRSVLDEVTATQEPTCIISNSGQVVLMNKEQYDNLTKQIDLRSEHDY